MIAYRTMTTADIAAGLSLCREFRWNQLARDWELFLHLGPDDCRVATMGEQTVGTVTTLRYPNAFSWIGMVLVDSAHQRKGIGIQLLKEALLILRDEPTIKLDATPAGREVYLKLNFVEEYRLSRMVANSIGIPDNADTPANSSSTPELLQKKYLPDLIRFDAEIFGADRGPLLQWAAEGAPEYAFLVKEDNKILGYCLGRPGRHFTQIGPVVATDSTVAKELVTAALHRCIGKAVLIDAPHHDPEWIAWLKKIGFGEQRPFIRMYRGSNGSPGIPEKQFAILGPEFG
jgi:GNAT superfamily N-acetyltransferase